MLYAGPTPCSADARRSDAMEHNKQITTFIGNKIDLIGFADLQQLEKTYPDLFDNLSTAFPSAVSIGKKLLDGVLDTIEGGPNLIYFHHYRQINFLLDRVSCELASHIEHLGFKALPIAASQITHRNPMKAHICHRRIAWQAGLGCRGLNNLLVTPEYGSGIRLASVLTDMPLESGTPDESACSKCGRCINACPAGAIGKDAEDFNIEKCRSKLDEFRKIPFIGQHICGVCVSVCRREK